MYREAYEALEAIRLGELWRLEAHGQWLSAFRTCQWVAEAERGPILTTAGASACEDLAKRYRKKQAA